MMIPIVQTISQSLRYFWANFGFSFIWPVIMSVAIEMNMNANGRDTVALFKPTSEIMMIANRPPKMKNDIIIREFMICLIRSTSISDHTSPSKDSWPMCWSGYRPFRSVQKGCALFTLLTYEYSFPKFSPHILYLKLCLGNCITWTTCDTNAPDTRGPNDDNCHSWERTDSALQYSERGLTSMGGEDWS